MKEGEDFLKISQSIDVSAKRGVSDFKRTVYSFTGGTLQNVVPLISLSQESCNPSFCCTQTKTESAITCTTHPKNVHDKTPNAAFAPELRSPAGCTCRPERRRAATGCSKFPAKAAAFNKRSPEDGGKTQST